MDRSGLLPGEIKPVQQIEHAVLTIGHAEALLGKPTEVLGRPAAEAVTLGIGPAQHHRFKGRHLAFTLERRSAAAWTIAQAPDALRVEADHPVPERLPLEAGLLGRPLTAHAVEDLADGQEPAAHPAIPFTARRALLLRSLDVTP